MSELVVYSTGVTVPSAWLNSAQLREEGLGSYVVYKAGSTYYAKALMPAGTDYSGTVASTIIQNALTALASTGGRCFLKAGTYPITTVLTIAGGVQLVGESREKTIISTPSPSGSVGKNWILNLNTVSGDKAIVLRDFTFQGGTPTITASSYTNYDNSWYFQGAYQSRFQNIHCINAGGRCDPFSGATAGQKQAYTGLNYDNIWENIYAQDFVGSFAIFSGLSHRITHCSFIGSGDDSFLLNGSGIGTVFDKCLFDGTNNLNPTIGSSTAQLFLNNDGSVGSATDPTILDARIANSTFIKHNVGTGQRAGIAGNAGTTLRVVNTLVDSAVGTSGSLTAQGGGIISLGVLKALKTVCSNGQANGISLTPIISGTVEDSTVEFCVLKNNGKASAGGMVAGVALRTGGATLAQYVRITDNEFFDTGSTQTIGIDNPNSPATPTATLLAMRNNFKNQPTTKININDMRNWLLIKDNLGVNPYGVIGNCFNSTNTYLGPTDGNTGVPTASTDYPVKGSDCYLVSTVGTGVSITIKDPSGTTIESGLTTYAKLIPVGYKINFGGFSVAPTIVAGFN